MCLYGVLRPTAKPTSTWREDERFVDDHRHDEINGFTFRKYQRWRISPPAMNDHLLTTATCRARNPRHTTMVKKDTDKNVWQRTRMVRTSREIHKHRWACDELNSCWSMANIRLHWGKRDRYDDTNEALCEVKTHRSSVPHRVTHIEWTHTDLPVKYKPTWCVDTEGKCHNAVQTVDVWKSFIVMFTVKSSSLFWAAAQRALEWITRTIKALKMRLIWKRNWVIFSIDSLLLVMKTDRENRAGLLLLSPSSLKRNAQNTFDVACSKGGNLSSSTERDISYLKQNKRSLATNEKKGAKSLKCMSEHYIAIECRSSPKKRRNSGRSREKRV